MKYSQFGYKKPGVAALCRRLVLSRPRGPSRYVGDFCGGNFDDGYYNDGYYNDDYTICIHRPFAFSGSWGYPGGPPLDPRGFYPPPFPLYHGFQLQTYVNTFTSIC